MHNLPSPPCVGLLLAAGRGRRFDPAGGRDKLLQLLPDGRTVVATAAANLLAAVATVVAVVRPDAPLLTRELEALGCEMLTCKNADDGMATSLTNGLTHTANATGWVVALADMPYVQPATISALVAALAQGADIAVPTYHGLRGNPVAFGPTHLPQLLRLAGDEGARSLLQHVTVTEVMVDDPGIRHDIDTPADLRPLAQ